MTADMAMLIDNLLKIETKTEYEKYSDQLLSLVMDSASKLKGYELREFIRNSIELMQLIELIINGSINLRDLRVYVNNSRQKGVRISSQNKIKLAALYYNITDVKNSNREIESMKAKFCESIVRNVNELDKKLISSKR